MLCIDFVMSLLLQTNKVKKVFTESDMIEGDLHTHNEVYVAILYSRCLKLHFDSKCLVPTGCNHLTLQKAFIRATFVPWAYFCPFLKTHSFAQLSSKGQKCHQSKFQFGQLWCLKKIYKYFFSMMCQMACLTWHDITKDRH